jgi:nicotinamide-nucleotide adenylyltransferase
MDTSPAYATPQWHRRFEAAREALGDLAELLAIKDRIEGAPHQAPVTSLVDASPPLQAARVGAFAGSFNPLTRAHTGVVEAARHALQMDAVLWMLTRVTVDKEQVERATLVDRAVQMRSYIRNASAYDQLALISAGLYTDQATALREWLPPQTDLWLIVGYDKVVQIFDARYYTDRDAALDRLFASARVLVAPRDSHTDAELAILLAAPENRSYTQRVRYLALPPTLAHVSSTAAREDARARGNIPLEALAELLAPEGAALALTTQAYAPPVRLASGELVDVYGLRQALIAALATTSEPSPVPLARLMERAAAPTDAGEQMRAWLRERPWETRPESVAGFIQRFS